MDINNIRQLERYKNFTYLPEPVPFKFFFFLCIYVDIFY
jgi:hypothetical protein